MAQFEKPVPLSSFPDYTQKVKVPMDLQTVEKKVKSAAYGTPEDFEYDVLLIFQNCISYNSGRNVDHLVSLGKYGTKQFKRIFGTKIKVLDDPSSVPPPKESKVAVISGASKKIKVDVAASKVAPRISLSSAQLTSVEKSTQRPKASKSKPKANQPVPLHIAISQVKEKFPLRRAVKSLQSWEAGCARFFKGESVKSISLNSTYGQNIRSTLGFFRIDEAYMDIRSTPKVYFSCPCPSAISRKFITAFSPFVTGDPSFLKPLPSVSLYFTSATRRCVCLKN